MACKALIHDWAEKMKRKIDEESLMRMEALYEKMRKTVEETNRSLSTISQLEETLKKYCSLLEIGISGKNALKS